MQPTAHIHALGTAVPDYDIHNLFVDWATSRIGNDRERAIFRRMASRSGIDHRWSVAPRAPDGGTPLDQGGFYSGNRLPSTAKRMECYSEAAPRLAFQAIDALAAKTPLGEITHLVVASCTGFMAPGLDQIIARGLGLGSGVERTLVGFMGCYAAVSALRVAHHIARSDPRARVLVVTVELSTLHMVDTHDVGSLLAMLQFADGAAAAIVTAEPGGFAADRFFATSLPDSADLIRWTIGDEGFVMHLSGEVPARIASALQASDLRADILSGRDADEIDAWAIHPGGRSILDAVEHALELPSDALAESRDVLRRNGNMSSATLMFVLSDMMDREDASDGIAMAFGPGLAAECFAFHRI
jgi:predicted naringenin-chalcone synthase